jgi:LPS-assembly protein
MRHAIAAAALALFLSLTAALPVAAQTANSGTGQPALFKADRIRNEQKLGVVVATGNVEFTQGPRTLLADSVTYNRRTDIVTATGNVSLLEPSGDVLFADHVELSGDLKNGIVENIRVLLSDNARMAAAGGRRQDGNRTELSKAVYSACKPCEDDPKRAPTWQVKAIEVIHDETEHDIVYHDAFIEFYGFPVLYTPYLSHPDPSVKRRSGFLIPTYGSDSELGALVKTPYYIDIAPTMDATFSPMFTTDEGVVAAGEFRHRLSDGAYRIEGSLTQASRDGGDSDTLRGHVRGKFRYDIDPTWRGGADVYLASDDTYLRRYKFDSPETLENRLFVEGFRRKNYLAANAYYFQGQQAGDIPGETPFVFPMVDYSFVGEPGERGGFWSLDAGLLGLTRTSDTSTYRLSVTPEWSLPYTSPSGDVYRLFTSVQADAYFVNDVVEDDNSLNTLSGTTGRFFPQAGVEWRRPLARTEGRFTQIVEPILGFIVAPPSQNHEPIPNEDSISLEFDDTNLFAANRFSGRDRVEGGPRASYGLHGGVFGQSGGFSSFTVGQSYRLTREQDFGAGSGLEDNFSDIVGRVRVAPIRYLDALYRFRLDKDDLSSTRTEFQVTAGVPRLQITTNYLFIERQTITDFVATGEELTDREEITINATSEITKSWKLGIGTRHDLGDDGGSLSRGAFLQYEDDCFIFRTDFSRTFTRDRDIRPADTIYFRFVLKTLGEFQTQAF